jgi:hypothetical protein
MKSTESYGLVKASASCVDGKETIELRLGKRRGKTVKKVQTVAAISEGNSRTRVTSRVVVSETDIMMLGRIHMLKAQQRQRRTELGKFGICQKCMRQMEAQEMREAVLIHNAASAA